MKRLLSAVLLGLVVASQPGYAADKDPPSARTAQQDQNAANESGDHHCDNAVSLFYLGNPASSGGFYNNPWGDCKVPTSAR